MSKQFENPIASLNGIVLKAGDHVTTLHGATYELGEIGRSKTTSGKVQIIDPKTRFTRWVDACVIPDLLIAEGGA